MYIHKIITLYTFFFLFFGCLKGHTTCHEWDRWNHKHSLRTHNSFHIFTSIPVILPQSSPPQGLWDLSSPTRNWTQATAMKELILITGPSGKSLYPLNVHSTVNYNSVREKEQKSSKRYRQNHKAYPWKTAHGPGYDRDSAFNSWRQRHEEMWDHEREQNQGHRSAMGLDTPPGQGTGKEDAIH